MSENCEDASSDASAYDRIGGAATVRRVVDRLYYWISRDDELFLRYFADVSLPRLRAHMVTLLSQALGGPGEYTGRELAEAHAGLQITAEHHQRVCDYVVAGLLVEHAPRDVVNAVADLLDDLRPKVVGR